MIRLISILSIICLLTLSLMAQGDTFEAGNAAYKKANYTEAIAQYTELINQGWTSPELHYNLANAYFKDEQLGLAILHYEKAYKAKPSDDNIEKNLAIAREEIDSLVIDIPDFFLVRYWNSFCGLLGPIFWLILQLVFAGLFIYGIYAWQLKQTEDGKLKGFYFLLIGLLLMILTYLAGNTAAKNQYSQNAGIIIADTSLRLGADERAEAKETLSEGVKVRIIDTIGPWYKVSLRNREVGWIEVDKVGII